MSHPRRCATAIFLTALFVSGLVNAQPAGGAKMLAPVEFHALDERPIDLATALAAFFAMIPTALAQVTLFDARTTIE